MLAASASTSQAASPRRQTFITAGIAMAAPPPPPPPTTRTCTRSGSTSASSTTVTPPSTATTPLTSPSTSSAAKSLTGTWRISSKLNTEVSLASSTTRCLYLNLTGVQDESRSHDQASPTKNDASGTSSRNKRWGDDEGGSEQVSPLSTQLLSSILHLTNARPGLEPFLHTLIEAVDGEQGSASAVFVIPYVAGFVTDAGFLQKRLSGLQTLRTITPFVAFNDDVASPAPTPRPTHVDELRGQGENEEREEESLETLLAHAVGGALIDVAFAPPSSAQRSWLETQIAARLLDVAWLAPAPMPRRRVAFVTEHAILDATRQKWLAARDLGIEIFVLSSGGWWLADHNINDNLSSEDARKNKSKPVAAPWAALVSRFIALDITPNAGLPARLVATVRACGSGTIDGLCAGADDFLHPVACAAHILGLPTQETKAYAIATDKRRTRQLEAENSNDSAACFEVSSLEDVRVLLRNSGGSNGAGGSIVFPVISKPTQGCLSTCVFRADDGEQLLHNVATTLAVFRQQRQQQRQQRQVEGLDGADEVSNEHQDDVRKPIVIEPYIAGPEVDVNLVLLDGELLFSEVVDEPPSPGDLDSASLLASFAESQALTPSRLPQAEQAMLVRSIVASVRRQGFRSGVFHCEARVRHSRCAYRPLSGTSGMWDLQEVMETPGSSEGRQAERAERAPSTFLLEVNARCPGLMSATATLLTSGVDFWSLQLLACIGDWTRFRQAATRFRSGDDPGAAAHVMLDTYSIEVSRTLVERMIPGVANAGGKVSKPYIDQQRNPMRQMRQDASSRALLRHVFRHAAMVKPAGMYGGDAEKWLWMETVVLSAKGVGGRVELLRASDQLRTPYMELVRRMDQKCCNSSYNDSGSRTET